MTTLDRVGVVVIAILVSMAVFGVMKQLNASYQNTVQPTPVVQSVGRFELSGAYGAVMGGTHHIVKWRDTDNGIVCYSGDSGGLYCLREAQ